MTLDSKPYFNGKVAFVPMKFIFETLNNTVGYSSATKQITVKYKGNFVFPITIKDGAKVYKFTKPAKRIVSLAPSITEILFAIGAGDLVVGRTKYCTYPAQAASVKSVGTLYEPDLESVINLDPDVVIAATHMNEDVMNALTKAKISTLTQESPAKIDQIYTLIEQLGRLTNKTYESRALVSSMKSKEDRINNIMKAIPASQRKEVYYVVGTGKSEYTAGKQTFIHEILVGTGLINVGSDVDKWSYSLEKLIAHNPEYLIGADYSFTTMKGSKNYSSLTALKTGKTIEVDTNVFSIPGPRIMDYSMKTLIEKLYPELAYQLRF
jgi:iron complex transport system substrate-binding protein